MIPTDTDGLLRDAGGARPRDDLDGLIERLNRARESLSAHGVTIKEWDGSLYLEAAAALVQLRDSEALARGKIVGQMIEIARLSKVERECFSNPEAWTAWCDVRVLERAERAEARIAAIDAAREKP